MFKNLLILLSLLLLSSCSWLIPKPNEMPVLATIFIHDNPKTGDFAIHGEKTSTLGLQIYYEVYEINGDAITIRNQKKFTNPEFQDISPKSWAYQVIDRQGNVKKAWMTAENGEILPTPVAKPNAIGSHENLTAIQLSSHKPIKTLAGNIEVDAINSYIYRADAGLISIKASTLEYYSDKVPFKILKQEILSTTDVGALLKTAEYLQTAGEFYLTEDYMKIYNQVTKEDITGQVTMELIDYGFAK